MRKCKTNYLPKTIEKIIELFVFYNEDLRKGNFEDLKQEIDQIIQLNTKKFGKEVKIINSLFYGINFEFIGIMSSYLFPSILYNNSFRLQILKNLKFFIKTNFTYEEIGLFLSKEIISTIGVKKGSFNRRTLELLRFYIQSYDKILDNSIEKFLPLLPYYKYKYHKLTKRNVIKRYTFIQKYATTYLFPNSFYFNLPGIFLDYNKDSIDFSNINGNILGLIHENGKMKKFLLLNTNLNELKKFKNDLIREIVFFENLDIYNLKKGYFKYRNYVTDIYNLYSDYKDDNFRDLSVNFKLKLYYKETNMNQHNFDLNSLIHIINTSKIPLDIEIHPEIKKSISYRNKLVTFYGSINYFIHIYDTKNKPLDRYWELFDILLKNTFSNGFIIHYKTGLLLSTNAFQEDFEKVRNSFMEFVWSFKLECRIYENLNYIPFSFYHLPNSTYYSNETNNWDFPVFEDKSIPEYFDHLAVNYKQEVKRLEDEKFKKRVEETLERLTKEIEEIKMTKNKTNN